MPLAPAFMVSFRTFMGNYAELIKRIDLNGESPAQVARNNSRSRETISRFACTEPVSLYGLLWKTLAASAVNTAVRTVPAADCPAYFCLLLDLVHHADRLPVILSGQVRL